MAQYWSCLLHNLGPFSEKCGLVGLFSQEKGSNGSHSHETRPRIARLSSGSGIRASSVKTTQGTKLAQGWSILGPKNGSKTGS